MNDQTKLIIHHQVLPFLNIALYLNNIPIIQSLTIESEDESNGSIEVRISADLSFIEPFHFGIPSIPAGADVKIPLEKLKINRDFLNKLTETEKAIIRIAVFVNEQELIAENVSIDIHPLEYFGGFHKLPELIAAYITPNHGYVYHIKKRAVEILQKQGLITAFEGYQSNDPGRVLEIISAIYSAIQSEEIVYSALPPGYEQFGQRLRLLSTIAQQKFGNCIDLSLLFAACLEAVNLNPVLIIVEGHAFVGCWLQDDKFPEVVNDDKTALSKRLSKGIREMVAIEATSICKGNNLLFSDALNKGEAQIVEDGHFLVSIDIKRARTCQIRPLPLLANAVGVQLDEEAVLVTEAANMEHRFDMGTIYGDELLQNNQPKTKQKIWERKLLDLSLRNNLLNLRMTRNMVQLLDIDISHLEDTLSDGKSFSIMPNGQAEVLRKYNLFFAPLHHSSPSFKMANDELKYNRLHTHYHQQDLDNILTYIHKNARLAIEENGSSTLYLAVGLLKWYDIKTPDQARYAPVLLIPVELNRRSVNSKFTLKSREEETMINITLLEFLRQEYELNLGALEQLPYDESGVDVAKVMATLRRAVMQLKGWDVEEQIVLGNFSFSKLILWKDIVVHHEALLNSPMVRSLIEGKASFINKDEGLADTDFDGLLSAALTLPIATDVSQMEAILTAQKGHSFILHGPPGTGKSQTITNIIADALYRGKRVLFVAAKKAALDVVHKRLEQIGLATFSLELHSNKSKKSDVLAQLSQSMEATRITHTADFANEALRLDHAKKEISEYVNLLHQKQPVGWSLYDCITALANYGHQKMEVRFIPDAIIQALNPNLWQQWCDWLPPFQSIAQLIIHPKVNALAALNLPQYSSAIHEDIVTQTQNLLQLIPGVAQQTKDLATAIHFPFEIKSKTEWQQFAEGLNTLLNLPDMPLELVKYLSDKENIKVYGEWSGYYKQYQVFFNNLLSHYNRSILNTNIAELELKWKQAEQSWFLPKWFGRRKIKKQLNLYRNVSLSNEVEVLQLFALNNQLQDVLRQLQKSRLAAVQSSLKNLYREEQTDVKDIDLKANMVEHLSNSLQVFGFSSLAKWMQILLDNQLHHSGEVLRNQAELLKNWLQLSASYVELERKYIALSGIHMQKTGNGLKDEMIQLQNVLNHLPGLKNWMNYTQLRNAGIALHAGWLIEAFETEECKAEELTNYFNYTANLSIAHQVIAKHQSLSLFNVDLFESKIEQYKKIAHEFQLLTIQELRLKLAAQLPNNNLEAAQSSEIGILQRAIKNRGRGISIRKLFDQIPVLLPRIAPCMLMSPISVAQYFDVDTRHFDLVIFDEASQLPTCEAVSALARAKQAVIVGDPKQMPPTSFFSTIKVDEENMDVEDLESILDDCLALSIPSKYLLRHYRSKHESLIAFSNVNYYDSKLLTFPSADDLNRKVLYHHIPGFYDKGKTRTNHFEVEAIVQYIKEHYSHPQKRKLSLGVVTFSQSQQNLVEDVLQNLFVLNPQIEQFAGESAEPLFIKNLENVQGDERDIILFSIGYGPDETGKVSMNFGPLNRNGGWRRLNVAVTRARYEMHVFATVKAENIDLSRTSSEGVAGLKAFLHFAEKGHLAIGPEALQGTHDKRHLSDAISKRLQEKGLIVKCNIGTSGFKIDIGIVHPDKPNQYILGIVIDGQYYYKARTTNDRERVMPLVLKALGWNIHRIWTMDWWENPDSIINTIVEKANSLQLQPEKEPEIEMSPQPAMPIAFEPLKGMAAEPVSAGVSSKQKIYTAQTLTPVVNAHSEAIYDYRNRSLIMRQMQLIIDAEAPISKSLLYRKLLLAWNTSRVGTRLEGHLAGIINEMKLVQTIHHQVFYWQDGSTTQLDYYRTNDVEKRSIEDIAPEEIKVALIEVVSNNLSLEEDELLRYLARTFGFAKVGRQIDTALRYAIDLAEKEGAVKREGGRVK